jgi:hypothetical protein
MQIFWHCADDLLLIEKEIGLLIALNPDSSTNVIVLKVRKHG